MKLKPTERRKLREHLENRFSLEELKTLAFDLGVPYESLPHQTTQVLGRELIAYSERTNSLRDLIKQALQRRPDHSLRHIAARLVAELHTKIRIETVSVMPRIASPGQTITVVYELHSDLATPEEVWLGASLIDAKPKFRTLPAE
jgi:hypothetical protein